MHHKRTIIIFSLFILLAVATSAFVFFYRERTDRIVQEYVAEITTCGNIADEADCAQKDFCEGIYEPTCPTCSSLQFVRCASVPPTIQVERTRQQKLCESTGGEWYKNNYGTLCLCRDVDALATFDAQRGCINK